ncbi:tail fiber assembly protein [Pantoea stewartii]|uniref:Phage tail protein n=1 Tax=Pantoea stewartii subsp. stewartii DC283 TaxID=660596 RepID=A0ABM6K533_PANSE|nr:tail fiber assembly protein [Pantoea stewartii]ARF49849.1 phage tail protein [Pantoea stewartii subsp. stewartii DC283]KAB0545486.1 tail fiber assembly protein [Pantoea stewartii subsp. stewartii]
MPELQVIENFKIVDTPKNRIITTLETNLGVVFLESEDGQDWYECQALFSDDTVKIMYDAQGVIRAVVDKPVPQRDNTYAVSMLWPVDMSVSEMVVEDYPIDCQADGTWRYTDGLIEKIPTDYVAVAENQKSQLMAAANAAIAPLQDAVDLGMATDEESDMLLEWKNYRVQLNRVDTSTAPDIQWPEPPVIS